MSRDAWSNKSNAKIMGENTFTYLSHYHSDFLQELQNEVLIYHNATRDVRVHQIYVSIILTRWGLQVTFLDRLMTDPENSKLEQLVIQTNLCDLVQLALLIGCPRNHGRVLSDHLQFQ